MSKVLFVVINLVAAIAFASSANYSKDVFTLSGKTPKVGLTTNVADLTKGAGNFGLQFFANDRLAATVGYYSKSFDEKRKKQGETVKLAVTQTHYSLGIAYHVWETSRRTNIVINPALAFGQDRDSLDVDNQNGLSIKLTGLYKVYEQMMAEVGAYTNNLDGGFQGDAYIGLGFLF